VAIAEMDRRQRIIDKLLSKPADHGYDHGDESWRPH
jgi:hypothetical protein